MRLIDGRQLQETKKERGMHTMKTKKTPLLLSAIAFTVMLAMCMGFTFAWVTDTERNKANFQAGVVNVTLDGQDDPHRLLNFTNLQPTSLEQLDDLALKELHNKEIFQKIVIENTGTMPVHIKLSMVGKAPCSEKLPYVVSETGGVIAATSDHAYACKNDLADVLQVLLYDEKGKRIEAADLMKDVFEGVDDQKIEISAGDQRTFYIAGLVPLTSPLYLKNADGSYTMYQGGHYHASLTLTAWQSLYEGSGDVEHTIPSSVESSEPALYFKDSVSSDSSSSEAGSK